jgi:hypothetical protein
MSRNSADTQNNQRDCDMTTFVFLGVPDKKKHVVVCCQPDEPTSSKQTPHSPSLSLSKSRQLLEMHESTMNQAITEQNQPLSPP